MAAVAQAEWSALDTKSVGLAQQVTAWSQLGSPLNVSLVAQQVAGWTKLGSDASISLNPQAQLGWEQLAVTGINLTPGIGLPPDYKLVTSTIYPDGKTYNGPAERCMATFEFLPANWPGARWFIDKIIDQHIAQKVKDAGLKPLTLKLYESGFRYIVEIEAATAAAPYVALAPVAWTAIIIGAFVLAALIVIFVTIKTVTNFIYKSPVAGIAAGVIVLGIAGIAVLGLAIWKGSSVKAAVAGKR